MSNLYYGFSIDADNDALCLDPTTSQDKALIALLDHVEANGIQGTIGLAILMPQNNGQPRLELHIISVDDIGDNYQIQQCTGCLMWTKEITNDLCPDCNNRQLAKEPA